ncbi:MAG TPA: Asp-tRNA(Asn)/Glu-tRNA(Gln) amidotransferase subunit GatA [Anaerolineae bacterium]|nr:Asp-tRNA(Asn)/Glu-tRNA(Gln) amidotransferase subunit GatA [Anaerolineae bacterium]
MSDELFRLTIHQAAALLRRREISSVQLTQAVLERIYAVDNAVKAYLSLIPEAALESAAAADRALAASDDLASLPALLGIPLAIKDVILVEGAPATCGSKILEDFVPPFEATVTGKLRSAGAVLLGKTNTDEFAMGSSTENSAYFTTRNPWDLSRVPGGSSGGSAAAVAADECLGALGSDTGGSVRQPASLCGVVGLKPTYGRVSRYGLVAFASSLDQIGALAKDVTDAALLLQAIAGHDPLDSTSVDAPVPDYLTTLGGHVQGMRIGVPREYFIDGMQPEVEQAVRTAIQMLVSLGAIVREISLPHTEYALPVYYLIAPAEASANLARYDGVRYGLRHPDAQTMWEGFKLSRGAGFGPEVKRRIMLGTYALSAGYYDAYYLKAQQVRTLLKRDFDLAFEQVDVLAAPVSPTTAFKIGEKADDPLSMYLADVFTLSLNLAGNCGLSVPCGFDAQGLPIGLQLIGPAFGEAAILRAAYAYEQAVDWRARRPEIGPVDW